MPQILIGTPAYDQTVTTTYLRSIFDLQNAARAERPDVRFELAVNASAAVDISRSILASIVLESPAYTHLLFVDVDQGFAPQLIWDMLDFDKEVTAAVYPRRRLDFDEVWQTARRTADPAKLQSIASAYVVPKFVRDGSGAIQGQRGFVPVTEAGTGVMLIKRSVFERLAEREDLIIPDYPPLREVAHSGRLLHCFAPMRNERGIPLSEDLAFCRRWVELCGGEIWANVTHEITHVGPFAYRGRYLDRIQAGTAG